ncbi:MAG TPA: hypothetical protein VFV49_11890, partial [Thermoanaerobaculia bacterium]|nr:hypothetical protein [Thermoanaerobaculia bacterium]
MVVLLALAGGCSQDQNAQTGAATSAQPEVKAAQASQELTPEQLGELGAQIGKTPDRAEALLSQHGMTKESFEAQIRKITENPDASKRYAEAYRK